MSINIEILSKDCEQLTDENNRLKNELADLKLKLSIPLISENIALKAPISEPYFAGRKVTIRKNQHYLGIKDDNLTAKIPNIDNTNDFIFKILYRPKTDNLFITDSEEENFLTFNTQSGTLDVVKGGNKYGRFIVKYVNGYFNLHSKFFESYFVKMEQNGIFITNTGKPTDFLILPVK